MDQLEQIKRLERFLKAIKRLRRDPRNMFKIGAEIFTSDDTTEIADALTFAIRYAKSHL